MMQVSSRCAICPDGGKRSRLPPRRILHLSRRLTQTVNYCFECEIHLRMLNDRDIGLVRRPQPSFRSERLRSPLSFLLAPPPPLFPPAAVLVKYIANDCESVSYYLSFSPCLPKMSLCVGRSKELIARGQERPIDRWSPSISRRLGITRAPF